MGYGIACYSSSAELTLSIDDSKLLVLYTQRINANSGSGVITIPTFNPFYGSVMVVPLAFQRFSKVVKIVASIGSISWTAPTGPYAVDSQVIVVTK